MIGTNWQRALAVVGLSVLAAGSAGSQPPLPPRAQGLPFTVGEELVYQVRLGKLGGGRGTMRVEGPEMVRGERTWVLDFHFRTRIALAVVEQQSRSWLDPERMRSLRYQMRERTPISSQRDSVSIYPEERRWEGRGASGATACDAPLDELSFIYYVRTLPLHDGAVHTLPHHYDPQKNPVVVRVLGRERVQVPAGEFSTVVAEMQVKDTRRLGAGGTIRLFLTDDAYRLPVRIESAVPVAGTTVFSLESWTEGSGPGR